MKEQWIASETVDVLLAEIADGQKTIVAGGTDLLIQMREMKTEEMPVEIIDISKVHSLCEIREEKDSLILGATVTYSDLINSDLVSRTLPILAQAAKDIGSPQVRNRGTLGGSLANASPAADMAPVWVLLQAKVVLQKQGNQRVIPVEEFLTGNMTTMLEAGELIVEIRCPLWAGASMQFIKVGRRNAAAIARLNGAALLRTDGKNITDLRMVIGAATPTPLDLSDACEDLVNDRNGDSLDRIAKETIRRVEGISGRRASATWKFPALENLSRRLLIDVIQKGGLNSETV